jgi:hypothetical protein
VDTVIEIPVSSFFDSSNYAQLEIVRSYSDTPEADNISYPCLIIPGINGNREILWGATYSIIMNFLSIISGDALSVPSAQQKVKKVLSVNYVTGYK